MTPRGRVIGLAVACACAAAASPAFARRDRNAAGDAVRAARLIAASRYDEARRAIADLEKRAPDDPDVKWLHAELAFHDGHYADAVHALAGVPDSAGGGMAGETRRLAASTLAVTGSFFIRTSPTR